MKSDVISALFFTAIFALCLSDEELWVEHPDFKEDSQATCGETVAKAAIIIYKSAGACDVGLQTKNVKKHPTATGNNYKYSFEYDPSKCGGSGDKEICGATVNVYKSVDTVLANSVSCQSTK